MQFAYTFCVCFFFCFLKKFLATISQSQTTKKKRRFFSSSLRMKLRKKTKQTKRDMKRRFACFTHAHTNTHTQISCLFVFFLSLSLFRWFDLRETKRNNKKSNKRLKFPFGLCAYSNFYLNICLYVRARV